MDLTEHNAVLNELEQRLQLHRERMAAFHEACAQMLAAAMNELQLIESEHRALQKMVIDMRDVLHSLEDQDRAQWN